MSDDLITAYEKRYQADSRDPSQAERLGVWTAAWNAATQGTGLTLGSFRAWPAGISAALGIDLADPWRGLYDPARMPKLDGVNDYHVAHPDLPKWPEDDERGISPLVKAQGFELEVVLGDYTEEGADDPDHDFCAWLAQWKPAPPAGDHWRLVCIQDTEDGPAALYVRPLALIDASPKGDDVAGTLRLLLDERNYRTDGDLKTLAARCLHVSREDRGLIAMRGEIIERLKQRSAKDSPKGGSDWEATDADIAAWQQRHDLAGAFGSKTDARAAFEDARSAESAAGDAEVR
ncbi:hypothetical protein [Pseudomonas sp.]|uniref:hypothetical protein n=1 Tax=Pseudomonas sp. TaxID=306 RepID=UPI003D0F9A69